MDLLRSPPRLAHRSQRNNRTSNPPSNNQIIISKLFDEWGIPGYVEHTKKVTEFYRGQCEAIVRSCEKHLSGLATWKEPKAGMFLWITLLNVTDARVMIEEKALDKNVLLVPGQAFMPKDQVTSCCRLSFSQETPERMDIAVARIAEMIKEAQS